jgi:DNA repair protein RadC
MPDEPLLFPERDPATADRNRVREAGMDTSGHRARLRKRLLEGSDDALGDHEVIEYLLMTAITRQDVKPLARMLLQRFGSLAGVFNADPRALMATPGVKETAAAALRIAGVSARRLARSAVQELPVLSSWQALLDYLHIDMAHLTHERVRVLYLNTQNRLILDDKVADGDIDEAAIHPRKVIHKAMDIGAAALILVHNHPSGSPGSSAVSGFTGSFRCGTETCNGRRRGRINFNTNLL